MRLVTYRDEESGGPRVGSLEGDGILPLAMRQTLGGPPSVLQLIRDWNQRGDLSELVEPAGDPQPLAHTTLCAPIPQPHANVICLGRNYAEHAEESARARGEEVSRPTFFTKAITAVTGPYDDIPYDPAFSEELDWEVELAVIIGRTARRVPRETALSHVFGYMVLNDVSARDVQYGYGGQFFYGKSFDGSCPTGPWIVTADEILDPQNLKLSLLVDGVTKQQDTTRNMIFDVAECIAILSRGMTLLPGQIIATGTPVGVGFARQPQEYLQPGSMVEAEVEGIGMLRNRVALV